MTSIINISENCSLDVYSNAVIVVEVWISNSVPSLSLRFASAILLSAALEPLSDQSSAECSELTDNNVTVTVRLVVVVLVLLNPSRDVSKISKKRVLLLGCLLLLHL